MKAKTLLLSLFFTILVIGLKAQDNEKYNYVFVQYCVGIGGGQDGIYIESADKDVEFIKIDNSEKRINGNVFSYRPLIKYIQSMVNDGWSVVTPDLTPALGTCTRYILRKKK